LRIFFAFLHCRFLLLLSLGRGFSCWLTRTAGGPRTHLYDPEASLREARARLPLANLIEQYGGKPRNGKWKNIDCPLCGKKERAGIHDKAGLPLFKCFSTSCPSGAESIDEVGFLAIAAKLSRKDAFQAYLKMAGVWRERTTLKADEASRVEKVKPKEVKPPHPAPSPEGGEGASSEPAGEKVAAVAEGVLSAAALERDGIECGKVPQPSSMETELAPSTGASIGSTPVASTDVMPNPLVEAAAEAPGLATPEPPLAVEGEEESDRPATPVATLADCFGPMPGRGRAVPNPKEEQPHPALSPEGGEGKAAEPQAVPAGGSSINAGHQTGSPADGTTPGNVIEMEFSGEKALDPHKALRAFYDVLGLSPQDEELLWKKRGFAVIR
jgi:hypothetical protein